MPDLSEWIIFPKTKITGLFSGCSSLVSLPDISKWDIPTDSNISSFFYNCSSLISLPDISKWNICDVKNLSSVFYNCSSLISLPDLSEWYTENVTNMSNLFHGCSSLVSIPNIEDWLTYHVTDMSYMFYGCSSLISLPNLKKWKVKKIKNISNMFFGCSSLISLPDLSTWKLNLNDNRLKFTGILNDCLSLIYIPQAYKNYKLDILKFQLKQNLAEVEELIEGYKCDLKGERSIIKLQDLTISKLKEIGINSEKKIANLKKELDELNNKKNDKNEHKIKNIKPNIIVKNEMDKTETPFFIIFYSLNDNIYYPITCKKNDLIYTLEEELCKQYKEYKNYNMTLTANLRLVKRYKTVEENQLKNGDMINMYNSDYIPNLNN